MNIFVLIIAYFIGFCVTYVIARKMPEELDISPLGAFVFAMLSWVGLCLMLFIAFLFLIIKWLNKYFKLPE